MSRPDLYPTAVAQAHTHRVVLLQPDRADGEFARIEELVAGGLRAARRALAVSDMPGELAVRLAPIDRALRRHVLEQRRLLSEGCRTDLGRHLAVLRGWVDEHGPEPGPEPSLEAMIEGLEEALEVSHRAAELIAAEHDIGWHRGIGSEACRRDL